MIVVDRPRGQRLRDYRTSRGVRQQELADRLGVHKSTISRLERGEIRIDRESELLEMLRIVEELFEKRMTPAEVLDE